MLETARRRAHEATRRAPGDLDAWVDLARAVSHAGDLPDELTPADFAALLEALAAEPSARDLAALAMAALGVEATPPSHEGSRWKAPGQAREDDAGPYDAVTGMPLAVRHSGLAMDFVWVPPGRYPLGWRPGDLVLSSRAQPGVPETLGPLQVHRSRELPTGYYLARTPTTQAQYRALTGEDPSFRKGDSRPVERVTSGDVDAAAALAEARRGGGAVGWCLRVPDANRWEIALRGAQGPRPASLEQGWFRENAGAVTHPVGQLASGLHGTLDQFGNVEEWCLEVDQALGPSRPDGGGGALTMRMARGGSWVDSWQSCGASRFHFHLVDQPYGKPRASVGMRLLLGLERGTVEP